MERRRTFHTSLLSRCSQSRTLDHTTSRCAAVAGRSCLRDSPRQKSRCKKRGRDHGLRPRPIFSGAHRGPSDQKPVALVSNSLSHRKRKSAKLRGVLYPLYCTKRSIESRTVRVLFDTRKHGVCNRILPRRDSLHTEPCDHVLHNPGIIHSTCTFGRTELPRQG